MQARRSDCGAAQRLALRAELPESEDGESSGSICCMSSSPSTPKHYPNKSHRLAISAHQAHPSTYEQRWHARLGQKAWYKVQVDMGEAIARARRLSQQSQAGVQRHPPAHTPCSPLSTAPRAAGSSCPKMRIALFAASVCVTSQDVTDRDGYNKEQGQARYLANVFEKDLKRIESRRVASDPSPEVHACTGAACSRFARACTSLRSKHAHHHRDAAYLPLLHNRPSIVPPRVSRERLSSQF